MFVDECFYLFRQKWYCWKFERTPETDSTNWGSIEHRLRTTGLVCCFLQYIFSIGYLKLLKIISKYSIRVLLVYSFLVMKIYLYFKKSN